MELDQQLYIAGNRPIFLAAKGKTIREVFQQSFLLGKTLLSSDEGKTKNPRQNRARRRVHRILIFA